VTRGRSTVAEVAAGGQLETARVRLDGALGLAVPIAVDGPVRPEGKLTARFALDRHASVTATVARKGRLPTLRERYRAAPGAELTDEQNDFVEVKVELGGAGLEVASAAWVRASDGLIKNDPATQTFTNTGALTLAGLDATATWGKGGRLEGGLAYSFVEAQDDTADEPLDFLARHRGHVYLATRPLRPLWTEVRLRVLGRRLDRGQWLPAHASLDLSASATWGGWLVTGQLTDALDARYDVRYRVPSAGRTVAATVTRRW
jgi:outer membrane cobalamin receptor